DDFPVLIWEEIQMDFSETEVTGSDLPMTIQVSDPSKRFKRNVVEYHVPIEGDPELLRYYQSNIFSTAIIHGSLSVIENTLCFRFIDVYNEHSLVESAFKASMNTVKSRVSGLKNEFDAFNNDLL